LSVNLSIKKMVGWNRMNKTKEQDKENNPNIFIFVILMTFLVLFSFIAGYVQGKNNMDNFNCKQYFDIGNVPTFLEKLSSDCGGTQFYFRDGNWNVWKQDCKVDGYCKYDYFPIYDCLE